MISAVALLLLAFATQSALGSCIGNRFLNVPPSDDNVTELFVARTPSLVQLNIPPRYMWGWGVGTSGYCGSASFQSSALFFGSWISEQFCRYAANNNDKEILVGDGSSPDDFDRVASTFGFSVVHFNNNQQSTPQINSYLNWAQGHLYSGHPVIGCVYAQEDASDADPDYDHIVPFVGVTMNSSQNSFASASSTLTNVSSVIYNDLWLAAPRLLNHPLAVNRSQWENPSAADTAPYAYATPAQYDFGVAVLGVRDDNAETFRTKLTAWSWTEPDWGDEDQCNEAPQLMNLSVAVFGLTSGVSYTILRFDGNVSVPTRDFANAKYSRRWDFVASGTTYLKSPLDTISTNTVASYRTVRTPTATATPTTAQPTSAPRSTPTPEAPEANDGHTTLYIVAAVGSVLIVAGFALLMRHFRKQKLMAEGYQGAPRSERVEESAGADNEEIYAVQRR